MDYKTLIVKKENHIATVVMNRPERLNAISPEMFEELIVAFKEVGDDINIRVMILTGAGEKAFCAGADVGAMSQTGEESWVERDGIDSLRRRTRRREHGIMQTIVRMEKPTIAMINGVCVAGGMEMASGCDMRIGSGNARFRNAFVRIGLYPGWGGCYLYPRTMGLGKAFEFLYTGEFMSAEEAYRVGFLNKLVPAVDLEKVTVELATIIANNPPIPIRLMKLHTWKGLALDFEQFLDLISGSETLTMSSEDHAEAVAAFREKRQGVYKGR